MASGAPEILEIKDRCIWLGVQQNKMGLSPDNKHGEVNLEDVLLDKKSLWFLCIYNLTVKSSTLSLQEPECLPPSHTFEAIKYSEKEILGSREALGGQWNGKKGK